MEVMGLKNFIVKNKTNEVKNYSEMCKLLSEEKTTGLGKINQLERWQLYFEFVQQGHKFIIVKIYDDEAIAKNLAEHETNKTKDKAYSYSKYTKYLMPIILFLLEREQNKEILMLQAEVARDCGFFNEEIVGKNSYSNYLDYRNAMKNKYDKKLFLQKDMKEFTYHTFLGEMKRDAYSKISTALRNLKKLNMIEYEKVNVGIKDDNHEKTILTSAENKKYEECKKRALENIIPTYNKLYNVTKETLTKNDIMYRFDIHPFYYNELNNLVKKNLDFNIVLEHLYINLLDNDYISKLPNAIYEYKQYTEYRKKINELVVNTVQKRIDRDISKKMKSYVMEKVYISAYCIPDEMGANCKPVGYENLTYNDIAKSKIRKRKPTKKGFTMDDQNDEKTKYYNKAEIINLLISFDPEVEVLDLDELEKQYFESYYELEDDDIDEDTKNKTQEIFKAFDEYSRQG